MLKILLFTGCLTRKNTLGLATSCCLFLLPINGLFTQSIPAGAELEQTILTQDSAFWAAYNACEVEKMMSFVAENVEFYHDKGGVTNSRTNLAKAMKEGLCRSGNNEISRRPVDGTIKVFPIAGVGAILSGQHTFHGVANPGDDGIAYFFHLWTYAAGNWKMTRVFSYDHAPLPANEDVPSVTLSAAALEKFEGTYVAPQTGTVTIKATAEGLSLLNGNKKLSILAKSATVFFNKQLPLEFKFTLDDNGAATKFAVFEKGVKVEEALRKQE
jgi:hypothetical protein